MVEREAEVSAWGIVVRWLGCPARYVRYCDGVYSLWDDPARATSWDRETDARTAMMIAPPGIQFDGTIVPVGKADGHG